MIGGQASFQFGGLWFGIVDPWPAAWLYTDAVYVDFIAGGYVLVNVVHPGIQIAVAVGDPVPAPAVCPPSVVVSSISGFGDSPSPAVSPRYPLMPDDTAAGVSASLSSPQKRGAD